MYVIHIQKPGIVAAAARWDTSVSWISTTSDLSSLAVCPFGVLDLNKYILV